MTEEISDFANKNKAKPFPEGVSKPSSKNMSGDLGGYNLGSRDPESDRLAKKHTRIQHDDPAGNKDDVYKGKTKDSLNDVRNKRLKGQGRHKDNEAAKDSVYESEIERLAEKKKEHWIQDAIKHPGALTKKANKVDESPGEFAKEHKHSKGKTGKQSRLALTLKKMHHESTSDCPVCGKVNCTVHKEQPKEKGKKLLIDKSKLREDTLANQIALDYLARRLEERDIISGVHSAGCSKPDYTGGMDINRTPDAEIQTDAKPAVSKSSKTKKYGEKKKIAEEILDELSQETKNKYKTAAGRDIYAKQGATYHPKDYETQADTEKNLRAQSNRRTGIQRASGVKESEELDELSQQTTDNYRKKALDQYMTVPKNAADINKPDYQKQKEKRLKGIGAATRKAIGEEAQKKTENLVELSKSLLNNYVMKSVEDQNNRLTQNAREPSEKNIDKFRKRSKDIHLAVKKASSQNEEKLDETLPSDASTKDYIDDFVHSKNKVFKGDSKRQRIKRALGAYYHRHESIEEDLNPNEFLKKRRLEKHLGYGVSDKEWNEVNKKSTAKPIKPVKEGLGGAVEPLIGEDGKKKKKKRTEDGSRSQTGAVPSKYQDVLRDQGQSI